MKQNKWRRPLLKKIQSARRKIPLSNSQLTTCIIVIVATAAIGYLSLHISRAAAYAAATEAESGSLSGNARIVSDGNASAGKAVQFSNGSTGSGGGGGGGVGGGGGTGGGGTGAPSIPTAVPSGFTRAFTEDFNTPAALGSFDSVYGNMFGEYTGCCSTNKFTQYSSAKVLYVQNGSMYYKLHSEGSTSYAAAPQPWNEKSFLYGQVGISVRLDSSNGPGYKIAFLLWPATNDWSNEVDFPEVDPDFTAPVRAASLNYSPNGEGENGFDTSQDNLNTGVYLTDNKYHTFLLNWTPGNITATIDGKVVATFTGSAVPSQAMRLSLQAEGWINQGSVPTSTTDILEVPWVYINTHN